MAKSKEIIRNPDNSLVINRYKNWEEYDDIFKEKVLSAIIDEQELHPNESLSISCKKHYIRTPQFRDNIYKFPVLHKRFDEIQYSTGKLSEATIIKAGLSTLVEIMGRGYSEKVEQRWDDKRSVWVDVKRIKYPNTDQQVTIIKFLLERLHSDYSPQLKQIRLQSAMDILKTLSKSANFTSVEAKEIEKGISNYLVSNGLNLPTDDIEDVGYENN